MVTIELNIILKYSLFHRDKLRYDIIKTQSLYLMTLGFSSTSDIGLTFSADPKYFFCLWHCSIKWHLVICLTRKMRRGRGNYNSISKEIPFIVIFTILSQFPSPKSTTLLVASWGIISNLPCVIVPP